MPATASLVPAYSSARAAPIEKPTSPTLGLPSASPARTVSSMIRSAPGTSRYRARSSWTAFCGSVVLRPPWSSGTATW